MGSREARAREPRRDQSREQDGVRAKAQELADSAGVPYNLALQVARGERSLNEVLEKLLREEETNKLEKKHGLPRSLAMQVALGQADLEAVLLNRALRDHLKENRKRAILDESAASQTPVALALHGQRSVQGTVAKVDQYEFDFVGKDGEETIHKLQAKFAYHPDDWPKVKKGITYDKKHRGKKDPVERPQDRYSLADRKLYQWLQDEATVTLTTIEGEALRGRITWLSRWELGMTLKGGAQVVVFRHAVVEAASKKES